MAYNPVSDFLALLRKTSGGLRTESMPGLDFVAAALGRAGLITTWVNPTFAPSSTLAVWLRTSSTSWAAECSVFLYNVVTAEWEPATPLLWKALLLGGGLVPSADVFQSVATGAANVNAGTTLLAINRINPAATVLTLPSVLVAAAKPLRIVDWSTAVVAHDINLQPAAGEVIMRQADWDMFSTADQLAGMQLYPSTDLNGWVIAP